MLGLQIDLKKSQKIPLSIRFVALPAVLAIALVSQVFLSSVPEDVFESASRVKIEERFREVLPQGWAFFTKPVSAENIVPYDANSSPKEKKSLIAPNASPQYIFGWDRTPRAQGAEIVLLLQGITKEKWTSCQGMASDECFETASTSSLTVTNNIYKPSICGQVIITAEATTPWEWRNITEDKSSVIEALGLDITCE